MAERFKRQRTVPILLFLTLVLPGSSLGQSLTFETIDIGEVSSFRYDDPSFTGAELIIRDKDSWGEFWRLHTEKKDPPPPLPKVVFVKEMVIAVFLGFQSTGGGPGIEISSVDEWPGAASGKKSGKGVKVTVKESRDPGPLAVVTNPYHIVKLKSFPSVLFEHSETGTLCLDNAKCGKGSYCAKVRGDCNGSGKCEIRPDACPLYFVYDPVCGCDGKTYDSECAVAVEGLSVLHRGRCETPPCQANQECLFTEFCLFQETTCSPPGACNPRPEVCTKEYNPVCGCDGVTYGNACAAYSAGASILHRGSCP